MWDRRANLPKGSAWIEFFEKSDANNAKLNLDGGQIDGNVIKVSFAYKSRISSPSRRCTFPFFKFNLFINQLPQEDEEDLEEEEDSIEEEEVQEITEDLLNEEDLEDLIQEVEVDQEEEEREIILLQEVEVEAIAEMEREGEFRDQEVEVHLNLLQEVNHQSKFFIFLV